MRPAVRFAIVSSAAITLVLTGALARAGTAPTGTYTATMGGTASTSSAQGRGGLARGRRCNRPPPRP